MKLRIQIDENEMILGNGGNQDVIRTTKIFTTLFGDTTSSILNICPASVILLGDHTHYNDGVLISACIDRYWTFLIKKRKDSEINLASTESMKITKLRLDQLEADEDGSFRLLKGLIKILKENDLLRNGFDCVVSTTVPECIGLGSSSAQQVGFLNCLRKVFSIEMDDDKLLSLVRKNELNIIGKISNIAHHYTVQFGKEKKLFYIDLRTMEYKTIPLDSDENSLVICDSGEKIINPEKTCNERIEECEVGVKGLRLYLWGIRNLRDIEIDFLHKHYHMLPKRIFGRVLYNVKERMRAQEALKHLRKKSIVDFGSIINESHKNLADDYELSNEHCDYLVKESAEIEGTHCSKLISCSPIRSTFHLVKDEQIENFSEILKNAFKTKFEKDLKVYIVRLAGGVKKISLKEIEFSNQ